MNLTKKLVVPFIIMMGFLVLNTYSITKGIDNGEVWRVAIAVISDLVIFGLSISVYLAAKKAIKNQESEA
jgi:hypothetical protein